MIKKAEGNQALAEQKETAEQKEDGQGMGYVNVGEPKEREAFGESPSCSPSCSRTASRANRKIALRCRASRAAR